MLGLSVSIVNALQNQYVHEVHNSHQYMTRAAWADYYGLENIKKFFEKQAEDEVGHSKIIYNYLIDRGQRIASFMPEIDATFGEDILSVFTSAYELENLTTEKLKAIYALAQAETDFMTAGWMLTGLIAEQVEEEDTFMTIVDRIRARLNMSQASNISDGDVMMASEVGAVLHDIDVWIGETYLG